MFDYLEGKNIILRKANQNDLENIFNNVWSDENIAKYMFWKPTKTYEDAVDRLNRTIEFQKIYHAYFVVLKDTDEAIGFSGVYEVEKGVYAESGLCIATKYQGMGYGKELLSLLLNLAFNKLNADKFIYECMNDNIKSKRLCLSFGFKYTHSKLEVRKYDNKEFNCNYYELNKEDYIK